MALEIVGVDPKVPIPAALAAAGPAHGQLDWITLNEAFSVQAMVMCRHTGLDTLTINPLGATGAITD